MAIWYNLWPFGIACGHFVYFFPFWYVWTKKNLATLLMATKNVKQSFCLFNVFMPITKLNFFLRFTKKTQQWLFFFV
jgi:hypothetical protein